MWSTFEEVGPGNEFHQPDFFVALLALIPERSRNPINDGPIHRSCISG